MTIRIWRKVPKDKPEQSAVGTKMPSIWKNNDFEEDWVEEARLPQAHERPIYSVSWSKKTGKVVSTGSDGKIVVYEESWRKPQATNGGTDGDIVMSGGTPAPDVEDLSASKAIGSEGLLEGLTEWNVVAEVENAHDVFEVNHAVWAPRADKGKQTEEEEVIVSTGDDGEVKVWNLET
ncbi:hypothetical protein KC343_g19948 [Hortaea werneckii]|nr:hypothetical protein KC317_g19955 [Hortaea werneckii]KAI7566839.1 hypothetical protein KC346_g20893 [Hortaea werneckii]KAI7583725.1 hypothetical protein KC343_g19948 [Hortaea werneckii]KAI7607947.1 hypothetical protein KC319_g21175 [Hortaea werneckii]KAI7640668.1 hypothetical protein KC322_g20516 [Hortaea werneckii]